VHKNRPPTRSKPSRNATARAPRAEADWGVYLLRKKAQRIGTVTAASRQEALARAVEQYQIAEAERFRVSVQRD
jgi:hypothetical protein